MACAVRSCRNEILRRTDLSFFPLPKHQHLRDEWLEVLGIERLDNIYKIKVCELHFKPKDFCETGRKQLKTHAVPVLKLGAGRSDNYDSDDEFMDYNSDGDQEMVEVPKKKPEINGSKIKLEDKEEEAAETNEEASEGRRPSRRAAREAAKKISHTVRSFMPKSDNAPFTPVTSPPPAASPKLTPRKRRPSIRVTPVDIDLVMECHEEILSPVQAEALLKAQLEYNMVMKTLRSLKASNAKIIFAKEPLPATQTTVSSASPVPNIPGLQITKVAS